MRIYTYDQTEYGFYTAVFDSYTDKNSRIIREGENVQLGLDDVPMPVTTDEGKAERVIKKIAEYDRRALWEIEMVLRSNLSDAPDRAMKYIRLLMRYHLPVRNRLAESAALDVMDALKKVLDELDRMRGFIRFTECENGVLYAPCSPDNDIIDLLSPHFEKRLPTQRFILHDLGRKKAVLYDGVTKSAVIAPLDKGEIILSATEEAFCGLWKQYYRSVNIAERKHIKQMKNYMPVRYWKFLPEKN